VKSGSNKPQKTLREARTAPSEKSVQGLLLGSSLLEKTHLHLTTPVYNLWDTSTNEWTVTVAIPPGLEKKGGD